MTYIVTIDLSSYAQKNVKFFVREKGVEIIKKESRNVYDMAHEFFSSTISERYLREDIPLLNPVCIENIKSEYKNNILEVIIQKKK